MCHRGINQTSKSNHSAEGRLAFVVNRDDRRVGSEVLVHVQVLGGGRLQSRIEAVHHHVLEEGGDELVGDPAEDEAPEELLGVPEEGVELLPGDRSD